MHTAPMPDSFSSKLTLVLKRLSLSRGRMAADMGVHKSAVGRWVSGAAAPSAHNLAQLTAQVARRAPGFSVLDWDRGIDDLALLLGAEPGRSAPLSPGGGLPAPLLGQALATTAQRGAGYEGFFRSTRPFAQYPGRFIHDQCLVRRDGIGLLRLSLATGSVFIDAWLLPLKDHVYVIGSDLGAATMAFGLLNAVISQKVESLDGLIMLVTQGGDSIATATAILLERTGDLTGDRAADDAHFASLMGGDGLAPEGSISPALQAHLARDIGPAQLALGGDWLLRMPAARSLSQGAPHPIAVRDRALAKA
ncbi:MAG TPA: helix-turn-helix transcriptional regulator [Caulobacteraceae bacterium]